VPRATPDVAGLSMIFAPLNVAAFLYIPRELRGAAVGLLALLRNEGGSVGTSVAQTILERREQFHALRLNEKLDPLNPAVTQFLGQGRDALMLRTGDGPLSQETALQAQNNPQKPQQKHTFAPARCKFRRNQPDPTTRTLPSLSRSGPRSPRKRVRQLYIW